MSMANLSTSWSPGERRSGAEAASTEAERSEAQMRTTR
jgi:hypothetical protein